MAETQDIVGDLMDKCSSDVRAALQRTLAIAPQPHLPIAIAAGATTIGFVSCYLAEMADKREPNAISPDPECVMLAALICAHTALDPKGGVSKAYRDLEILRRAAAAH